MDQEKVQYLKQQLKEKIQELEGIIKALNEELKETPEKHTTITFQSNPAKKIEDTSTLLEIKGGINTII
jgi:hypothetical protein